MKISFAEPKLPSSGVLVFLVHSGSRLGASAKAVDHRDPGRVLSFQSMLVTYQATLREDPHLLVQCAYHCPRGSPTQVALTLTLTLTLTLIGGPQPKLQRSHCRSIPNANAGRGGTATALCLGTCWPG